MTLQERRVQILEQVRRNREEINRLSRAIEQLTAQTNAGLGQIELVDLLIAEEAEKAEGSDNEGGSC